MKQATSILLALACVLAYLRVAQAECCDTSLILTYSIGKGTCADAGGKELGDDCFITICADGRPFDGLFCGRGSCNASGCDCENGCITGNWKQSFLDNNKGRDIKVTAEEKNAEVRL